MQMPIVSIQMVDFVANVDLDMMERVHIAMISMNVRLIRIIAMPAPSVSILMVDFNANVYQGTKVQVHIALI